MHETGKGGRRNIKMKKTNVLSHQFDQGKNVLELCKVGTKLKFFFFFGGVSTSTIFFIEVFFKVIFLTWNYTTLIILLPGIGIYIIFRQILAPNLWRKQENPIESCRAAPDSRNAHNFVRLKKLGRIVIHVGTDNCCCATRLNIITHRFYCLHF